MGDFGYKTIGGSSVDSSYWIRGSVFTITENGVAQSITAYVNCTYIAKHAKCAIYKHSDLSLVGVTEEKLIPHDAPAWYTFNFADPKPTLTSGTAYILVYWGDAISGMHSFYYNTGDTDQGHAQNVSYNSFPNPLVPIHSTRKHSIYCTYSTGVAHTQTCSEILGLVDGKTTKTAFHKTASEVLGLVDDHDKNRCQKCKPSSVILTF